VHFIFFTVTRHHGFFGSLNQGMRIKTKKMRQEIREINYQWSDRVFHRLNNLFFAKRELPTKLWLILVKIYFMRYESFQTMLGDCANTDSLCTDTSNVGWEWWTHKTGGLPDYVGMWEYQEQSGILFWTQWKEEKYIQKIESISIASRSKG